MTEFKLLGERSQLITKLLEFVSCVSIKPAVVYAFTKPYLFHLNISCINV